MATFVATACLGAPASAQTLVGLDFGGNLFDVDIRTGTATFTGSTGLTQETWTGLTRSASGRLFATYGYWDTPYGIYELDQVTGAATLLYQTPFIGVSCLAVDAQGFLFFLDDASAPLAHGPYELHRLDPSTGQTTLIGSTGVRGIITMDFDDQGKLWAFDVEVGLVEIDLATGAAVDVNTSFVGSFYPARSLTFGDDGALWMIDLGLWIGDATTGVPCLVAPLSFFGIFVGLEYLPGPTPPFALWTQGETGGPMGTRAVGATPHGLVALAWAQGGGGPTPIPAGNRCAGLPLDLNATMAPLQVLRADAQGRAQAGPAFVPAGAAGLVRLQAVDLATCRSSNLARIVF